MFYNHFLVWHEPTCHLEIIVSCTYRWFDRLIFRLWRIYFWCVLWKETEESEADCERFYWERPTSDVIYPFSDGQHTFEDLSMTITKQSFEEMFSRYWLYVYFQNSRLSLRCYVIRVKIWCNAMMINWYQFDVLSSCWWFI